MDGLAVKFASDVVKGVNEATKLGRKVVLLYIESGGEKLFFALRLKIPEPEPSKPATSPEEVKAHSG